MKRFISVLLMCVITISVIGGNVSAKVNMPHNTVKSTSDKAIIPTCDNVAKLTSDNTIISTSNKEKKTPSNIAYTDIEQQINKYMKEREDGIAGCSIAVIDGQNTIYKGDYGCADLENDVPVNADTVYEWGSVSKLLVWVSVMQLYEEGKIDWNTDISEYLPDDFLEKRSYNQKITMLNLMNHNAGWQETTYDIEVKDESKIVSLEQALRDSEPSQIYPPGEITAYSNWGTALAAYIVERISGMSYGEYVQKNIFGVLGMKHTSIKPDCSDNPWVKEQREKLKCYSITQDSHESYGSCIRYILLYPAGAAIGTMEDFITFAKAFTTDSKDSLLFDNKNTLDTMLSASSYYGKPGTTSGLERVCHGLWTMEYGIQVKGHGGNTSGCSANFMFDDKTGLAVVVMTNEVGETAFCYGIPMLIYGSIDKRENLFISETSDIHGIYQCMRSIQKGFMRFCNYTGNLFPISRTDNKGQYKLSMGEGTLTQIEDQLYLFDNGNGMQNIQYLYQNEKGETYLQQYTSDYKRANTISFWFHVIELLLSVVAILFAYLSFIIILVKLVIRKTLDIVLRKERRDKSIEGYKNTSVVLLSWLRMLNLMAMMVIGVLCYQYLISPMDGGSLTKSAVVWKCIMNSILSVIPVIYTVILVLRWRDVNRYKVGYIMTAVMGLLVTFSIWYWQWYNFIC
jgi:CubicO group peptidase (beta-lactamase class C family)